ncbi:MAG: AsmA family protein [Flavobacteriia bacterium]|nr:AsmA family protein [Flavobacteriia bacterium]
MRKILRFLFVLIALLVITIVLIPILFKDQIFEMVRTESANHIKGEVVIGDMSLSLFSDFPNLTLGLEGLQITGEGTFEGMDLIKEGNIDVEIDLFSAFSGDQIQIESIRISDADLYVLVMPDGEANYDIAKESAETEEVEEESTESANYTLSLKDFRLDEVNLVYDDRQGDMYVNLKNLTHRLSGDFSADVVDMSTHTEIEEMTVSMGSTDFLRKTNVEADVDMVFNTAQSSIKLTDNSIRLNGLELNAAGSVTMGDVMDMDLKFNAPHTEFAEVLSLIPEIFYNDFEDIETAGAFSFDASVKGTMDESESLPAFSLNLKVSDASFQYPDLPAGAENLNLQLKVSKPQGTADATVIEVPTMSGLLAGQPIEGRLLLKTPISDPDVDLYAKTNLDLAKVAALVPQEDISYSGRVITDIDVKGKLSDFESQNTSAIEAEGVVQLSKFKAATSSFNVPFALDTMNMNWSPQRVAVTTVSGMIGESDFAGTGRIDNLLSYVLTDTTLRGRFTLESQFLNLDELSSAVPAGEEEEEEEIIEEPMTAIRLPQNLDLDLKVDVNRIQYDGMTIEDASGNLSLVEGVAMLDQFSMKTLDGRIGMDGTYDSRQAQPEVFFDFNMVDINIAKAVQQFDMLKAFAPVLESATGNLNTSFSMNGFMGEDMTPDLSTINVSGLMKTMGVKVEPEVMTKLGNTLNNERYSRLTLGNTQVDFTIREGRFSVRPFDITVGGRKATVSGSSGLDQSMDYTMITKLPIDGIQVPANVAALGITGDIDVAVKFTGTFTDPKISTNFGDITSDIQNQVQNAINNTIEEQRQNLTNRVNEEAERIMERARVEAQRIKDEAKVQADRIRSEGRAAAQRVRDEAKTRGDQLIAQAGSNPIAKAAAERAARELREEADEQANNLIAEADRRATNLENEAASRADEVIAKAEQEAQIND